MKILNYSSDLPLNLPHLTVLNLSHNKICKVPDSLFGFIHLRLLDLSFNKIDNVPSTISLFHDLRKLDLSHNELSKIPSSVSNLKRLEKLNVSHNKLEHLPLSLGNMPSLQVVLATANPLQQGLQEGWEEAGSGPLLAFLRRCYAGSVPALPADHISLGNAWSRVRGPVFDSSVLNSGAVITCHVSRACFTRVCRERPVAVRADASPGREHGQPAADPADPPGEGDQAAGGQAQRFHPWTVLRSCHWRQLG